MKLRSSFVFLLGGVLLQSNAFSMAQNPGYCPSSDAIRGEGVSLAYNLISDAFAMFQFSKFGTEHKWLFGMGVVKAFNEGDALKQGNDLLHTLSGNPVPQELENGQWGCIYQLADSNVSAVAYQTERYHSPLALKPYLMRRV